MRQVSPPCCHPGDLRIEILKQQQVSTSGALLWSGGVRGSQGCPQSPKKLLGWVPAALRAPFCIWSGRSRFWSPQTSRVESDSRRSPAGTQWAWGMSGEQSEWVWGGRGGSCRRGPVGTSLTLLEANYELLRSFQIANHT